MSAFVSSRPRRAVGGRRFGGGAVGRVGRRRFGSHRTAGVKGTFGTLPRPRACGSGSARPGLPTIRLPGAIGRGGAYARQCEEVPGARPAIEHELALEHLKRRFDAAEHFGFGGDVVDFEVLVVVTAPVVVAVEVQPHRRHERGKRRDFDAEAQRQAGGGEVVDVAADREVGGEHEGGHFGGANFRFFRAFAGFKDGRFTRRQRLRIGGETGRESTRRRLIAPSGSDPSRPLRLFSSNAVIPTGDGRRPG